MRVGSLFSGIGGLLGNYEFQLVKVGKKNTGRILDGETWDEVPNAVHK